MATPSTNLGSINELIARLQRGNKIYNAGSIGPTPAHLRFDADIASKQREARTGLQELLAFTNRDRSRAIQSFDRAKRDLGVQETTDRRNLASSVGGRGMFGSTPGNRQFGELSEFFTTRNRDLATDRERSLADIQSNFTTGSGRFNRQLADLTRSQTLATRERGLQAAQQAAQMRSNLAQSIATALRSGPYAGRDYTNFFQTADPGVALGFLKDILGSRYSGLVRPTGK